MAKNAVLIVDDEPLVALYLSDLVQGLGYQVLGSAATHREAMELAKAQPPDIALVDVSLNANDDGVALAQELSAAHGAAIIFLSGHGNVESWAPVKALQPVAVLQKPCFPADLEHALAAGKHSRDLGNV